MVKVCEAEEGLDVLYLARFGPITDCLDFVLQHCQTVGGKEVPEVLHQVQMELTPFGFGVELVLAELLKHFLNMFSMVLHVVQVD